LLVRTAKTLFCRVLLKTILSRQQSVPLSERGYGETVAIWSERCFTYTAGKERSITKPIIVDMIPVHHWGSM